jgi:hypothetical protein
VIRFKQSKAGERKNKGEKVVSGAWWGAEISLRKRLSKLVPVKQLCKAKD